MILFTASLAGAQQGTQALTTVQGGQMMGGMNVIGSVKRSAIGTPAAPTVNNIGTAGSTSVAYYCVARDVNGNDTIPSSATTNTTSNATFSATNYNQVICTGKAGTSQFVVLKANNSHYMGICNATSSAGGGASCEVDDNTTGAGTSYTAQTIDQTGTQGDVAPYFFTQNTSACRAFTGTACYNPTVTLPTIYSTATTYAVVCSCVGIPSGTPAALSVIEAAASPKIQIGEYAASTAGCMEVDCAVNLVGVNN